MQALRASTAFLLLTNTYLELVSGSSYITINNSGSITLYVSSQNNLQLSGGVMTLNFAGYSASVSVGQYGLSTQGMNLQGNLHLGATGQSSTWWNGCSGTERCVRRGSHTAVRALEKAMLDYLDQRNENPKPFVWTADADLILGKVDRLSKRISRSGR